MYYNNIKFNSKFEQIKYEYENGIICENDLSEAQKGILIEWYKTNCQILMNRIKEKKADLYKKVYNN